MRVLAALGALVAVLGALASVATVVDVLTTDAQKDSLRLWVDHHGLALVVVVVTVVGGWVTAWCAVAVFRLTGSSERFWWLLAPALAALQLLAVERSWWLVLAVLVPVLAAVWCWLLERDPVPS